MKKQGIFTEPIRAVNIGTRLLGEALEQQKTNIIYLNWRPPREVQLSAEVLRILERME